MLSPRALHLEKNLSSINCRIKNQSSKNLYSCPVCWVCRVNTPCTSLEYTACVPCKYFVHNIHTPMPWANDSTYNIVCNINYVRVYSPLCLDCPFPNVILSNIITRASIVHSEVEIDFVCTRTVSGSTQRLLMQKTHRTWAGTEGATRHAGCISNPPQRPF